MKHYCKYGPREEEVHQTLSADIGAARTDPVFNQNLRSGLSITVSALEPKSTGRHHLALPPLI